MTDVYLNWVKHRFAGWSPAPCRLCGEMAMCCDENGRPCHKVCAEEEATRADTHLHD